MSTTEVGATRWHWMAVHPAVPQHRTSIQIRLEHISKGRLQTDKFSRKMSLLFIKAIGAGRGSQQVYPCLEKAPSSLWNCSPVILETDWITGAVYLLHLEEKKKTCLDIFLLLLLLTFFACCWQNKVNTVKQRKNASTEHIHLTA